MSTMRPIRTLATALLVASLAVAGCGRDQPDQPTTPPDQPPVVTTAPTPKAPAPAPAPTPKAPAPAPAPTVRPRILSVTTTPELAHDGGWLRLPATGTVIFRVRATNTLRVRFTLTPTGTNTADLTKLLGEDTDGRDDWTLAYTDRAGGHLGIAAIGAGGRAERMLNVYRAEPAIAPRILSVTTSPTLPREGSFLRLPAGAGTVTFRVQATHTTKVRFLLSPTGTDSTAKLLGEDTNGCDGWTLAWRYPDQPLTAHLTIKAIGSGGTSPDTVLGLYHPDPTS
jgi:hypothetical protein